VRIGIGYDVHQLVDGRPLILGGINIPFKKGLGGYSDADVVCHAIADAILGAGGFGDLGEWFPSDDPQWKGVSSIQLLKEIAGFLKEKSFSIINVDTVIIAQAPRLSPYRELMIKSIAEALKVDSSIVSIKSTSTDGLGFTGKGEGIAVQAVVLLG